MIEIGPILDYCRNDMLESYGTDAIVQWAIREGDSYIEITYADGPTAKEVYKRYHSFFNKGNKHKAIFDIQRGYSDKTLQIFQKEKGLETVDDTIRYLKDVDLVGFGE